jgi:hypothetical protein
MLMLGGVGIKIGAPTALPEWDEQATDERGVAQPCRLAAPGMTCVRCGVVDLDAIVTLLENFFEKR